MRRCMICLQELDLFQGLDTDAFMKLCKCTAKKKLAKGDALLCQGEITSAVYLIKAGKLKLTQITEDGREAILDICGPGEIIGELSFFHEQSSTTSAIAMEETFVCCFSRSQFEALIREDAHFALRIISYLGEKRYENLQKLGEDTRQTVKEKLLRLFYRFAGDYGKESEAGTLIDLKITQQELADMIGSSRVMVIHALQELEAANIIGRVNRQYLLKPDPCTSTHTFT